LHNHLEKTKVSALDSQIHAKLRLIWVLITLVSYQDSHFDTE